MSGIPSNIDRVRATGAPVTQPTPKAPQADSGAFQAILDAALEQVAAPSSTSTMPALSGLAGQSAADQVGALIQQARSGGTNGMPLALAARLAEWQALQSLQLLAETDSTDASSSDSLFGSGSGTDLTSILGSLPGMNGAMPANGSLLSVDGGAGLMPGTTGIASLGATGAGGSVQFQTLKPLFQEAERATGVPWQIQAAQWALESGWGAATPKDMLSGRESYNLFGVKGQGSAGSVVAMTNEFDGGEMVSVPAAFRAYGSYADSIMDHARLLTTQHYAPAQAAGKNLQGWADQLQNLGYATDPQYSQKLMQIIRSNGWDRQA